MNPIILASSDVPMDGTDPLASVIAWAGTWAILRWAPAAVQERLRTLAPLLAVLLAVLFRAAAAVLASEPFSMDLLLRALASGAVAVWGHSQTREVFKALQDDQNAPASSAD